MKMRGEETQEEGEEEEGTERYGDREDDVG